MIDCNICKHKDCTECKHGELFERNNVSEPKNLIAFGIIGLTEVVLAWYNIRGRDKTDDEIQEQWCSENIKH